MKSPQIYTLHQISNECTLPRVRVRLRNGKWYPARPLALCSMSQRFERAWIVFTGRGDVVVWEDQ